MPRKITIDPEVMGGLPCLEGTRIPVSAVLREIAKHCALGGIRGLWRDHVRPDDAKEALWWAAERMEAFSIESVAHPSPHMSYSVGYCKCGTMIRCATKFCHECGRKLRWE